MVIFKKEQKGSRTELNLPNWVAALTLTAVILGLFLLLVKYLPAILLWL